MRCVLALLDHLPVEFVILDIVWDEAVIGGRVARHADAAPIHDALAAQPRRAAPPAPTADDAVVLAAVHDGTLVC